MFGLRPAFPGGIRLPVSGRRTADGLIRQLPFAPLLRLPLRQHAGAAAVTVVRVGDEVVRGQLLARAADETAVSLHAPATGRIVRISEQPDPFGQTPGATVGVIDLAPLPGDTQEDPGRPFADPATDNADQLLAAIRETGLVGLGGEAVPIHLRLSQACERGAKVLVVNGVEGEPGFGRIPAFLQSHAHDLGTGLRCLDAVLGLEQAVLAVEEVDGPAAGAMVASLAQARAPALDLQILPPWYPQGAAELLLRRLAELNPGGRALSPDQAVVFSLATVAELGRLLAGGLTMTDQVVSLAGDGLREPGNYRVPLGTPVGFALQQAGLADELDRVLIGGPMRGQALADLDRPVVKGSTGFVAVAAGASEPLPEPMACIRCGECVAVCPLGLHPAELGLLARREEVQAMVSEWHLERCFECGCCAYVCPSHIPLVHQFRAAKTQWQRLQHSEGSAS